MAKTRNISEEVARVAYGLYEKRGKAQGHDVGDWLEAERIVMRTHARESGGEAKVIKSTKRANTPEKTKSKSPKRTI
jgi:hypothetical protein